MMCGLVTAVSRRLLLLLHLSGLLMPSVLLISLVYAVLLLFIPLMGRAGTASYPDLFVGCVVVSAVIVLSAWQVIDSVSLFVSLSLYRMTKDYIILLSECFI